MMNLWINLKMSIQFNPTKHFWIAKVDQKSQLWHSLRYGRLTGTQHGSNKYAPSKEYQADIITARRQHEFDSRSLARINYGNKKEPEYRRVYVQRTGYTVEELGFCIPKFDTRIGCSPDGYIRQQNGIIEIKAPQHLAVSIKNYIRSGRKSGDYDHIPDNHYRQMQWNMACTATDWCDYIVGPKHDRPFVQRINYQPRYFKAIYKDAIKFYSKYVKPRLDRELIIPK